MQFHSVPLPYQSSFLTNVHYLHRFDATPSIEQLWNYLLQGQLHKKGTTVCKKKKGADILCMLCPCRTLA